MPRFAQKIANIGRRSTDQQALDLNLEYSPGAHWTLGAQAPTWPSATVASAMGKRSEPKALAGADKASLRVCELKVDGMTCGGCERAVKAALSKDEGFADAEVSYKKGNVLIHYDPAKTTPEKLAEVVTKKAGYKASVKEAKP